MLEEYPIFQTFSNLFKPFSNLFQTFSNFFLTFSNLFKPFSGKYRVLFQLFRKNRRHFSSFFEKQKVRFQLFRKIGGTFSKSTLYFSKKLEKYPIFQTFSNLFKPFFKPFQTFSNLFQTFSNLFRNENQIISDRHPELFSNLLHCIRMFWMIGFTIKIAETQKIPTCTSHKMKWRNPPSCDVHTTHCNTSVNTSVNTSANTSTPIITRRCLSLLLMDAQHCYGSFTPIQFTSDPILCRIALISYHVKIGSDEKLDSVNEGM